MDLFDTQPARKLPNAREVLIVDFGKETWIAWPTEGERGDHFDVVAIFPELGRHERWDFPRDAMKRVSMSGGVIDWRIQSRSFFNKYSRACLNLIKTYGEAHFYNVLCKRGPAA